MEKKSIWKRPWFWIILIFSFFPLIIAFIFALRWFILYPWSGFWPHHKTSSEVDAAIINSILAAITSVATVAVTSWITYIINKQTQEITKEQGKIRLKDQLITKRIESTQQLITLLNKLLSDIEELLSKRKEIEEKIKEEIFSSEKLVGVRFLLVSMLSNIIGSNGLSEYFTRNKSFLPSEINKNVNFLIQKLKKIADSIQEYRELLDEENYNKGQKEYYSEIKSKIIYFYDLLPSLKEHVNETINYLFEADLNED